ncbi:DUF6479 family protein [Streptomyces sp. NPDC059168]|uniref:DUF6479 family protein n=1 Tax=Streptomyces sp. NPDC059168 TaxID=3346753 RepID=UPI0036AD5508
MNTATYQAVSGTQVFGYVLVLVVGVALVAGLLWAFRPGVAVRRREPAPPLPEEQPELPPSGPVREASEMREPLEMPRTEDGSERLTPHRIGDAGSRRADDQRRPRWSSGSGGTFGGGGGGRT